jgi:hypothetical protein
LFKKLAMFIGATKKISTSEAIRLAEQSGWDFKKDFHEQSGSGMVADLLAIAKLSKYRKSPTSSGSTARAYFYYLQKKA